MAREVVFGKPDGVKAKLLRPAHLLQCFLVVLHLRLWLRQLHRLEEPEFHRCLLCCNASDNYTSCYDSTKPSVFFKRSTTLKTIGQVSGLSMTCQRRERQFRCKWG